MHFSGRKLAFWIIIFALPAIAFVIAIGYVSYWTVPNTPLTFSGDPIIAYDPEIGFVPRPNSSSARMQAPDPTFHIYRIGAEPGFLNLVCNRPTRWTSFSWETHSPGVPVLKMTTRMRS